MPTALLIALAQLTLLGVGAIGLWRNS